ncbi:hypothetical protein HOC37_05520 [bacterium]|jgi:hypothetical protein|nr:hypothetical protein [bacterium]
MSNPKEKIEKIQLNKPADSPIDTVRYIKQLKRMDAVQISRVSQREKIAMVKQMANVLVFQIQSGSLSEETARLKIAYLMQIINSLGIAGCLIIKEILDLIDKAFILKFKNRSLSLVLLLKALAKKMARKTADVKALINIILSDSLISDPALENFVNTVFEEMASLSSNNNAFFKTQEALSAYKIKKSLKKVAQNDQDQLMPGIQINTTHILPTGLASLCSMVSTINVLLE